MTKTRYLMLSALVGAVFCLGWWLQLEERRYTVGVVNLSSALLEVVRGFKADMEEHGYKEGKNITYLFADQVREKSELDNVFAELLKKRVDLIFVLSTPAAVKAAAVLEGSGIPAVFAGVYDPIQSGLASNMKSPDKNLTGVKAGGGTAKALEWLMRIRPSVKKVYVPKINEDNPAKLSLRELQKGAEQLRVELVVIQMNGIEELNGRLENMPQDIDAMFVLNSVYFSENISSFVDTAIRRQIPFASGIGFERGVPIWFGPDRFKTGKQAGVLAHKILEGVPVSSLPIEEAELSLGINLKTAIASGFEISNDILAVADIIIR